MSKLILPKGDIHANTIREVRTKHPLKTGRYYASKSGKVYWKTVNGELRPVKHFVTKDGYHECVLTRKDGSKQHVQVQCLILSTFKGVDKADRQVNHKDGKRSNNQLANLEYLTPKQNIAHSFKVLGKKVWNSPKK